jgi:hypothetical protein
LANEFAKPRIVAAYSVQLLSLGSTAARGAGEAPSMTASPTGNVPAAATVVSHGSLKQ